MNREFLDLAFKYAEKALLKKQPIQRDRQLREVLVQAYFAIKNYEKIPIVIVLKHMQVFQYQKSLQNILYQQM